MFCSRRRWKKNKTEFRTQKKGDKTEIETIYSGQFHQPRVYISD